MEKLYKVLFLLGYCLTFACVSHAGFENLGLEGRYYEGRFLVYASNYRLAREIGNKLRGIYEQVVSDIGYSGAYKTKYQIFIWDNKQGYNDFKDSLKVKIPPNSSAFFMSNFKNMPTIAGYVDNDFLNSNIPHEFTHLVLRELLGAHKKAIPLWFDEGLANYEGGVPLRYAKFFLRKQIEKNSYLPLSELISMKAYPEDEVQVKLFYLEAQTLVAFLLDRQKRKGDFLSFMRWYIVRANPFNKAYLYVYGESGKPEKVEKEWIEYIMND